MMAAHVRDRYAFQGAGGEIQFLLSRAVHSEKSGREKRMVRGRILHLSKATVPALAAAFVGFATLNSACSLLFSTSKEQCKSDDECRARGAGFENTRCSLESLCVAGPEVDRLARLLLEREDSPETGGRLRELLDNLNRRWRRQRLRELANEIREAVRQGEPARLDALLSERDQLNRALHSLQPRNQGPGPR